MLLRQQRVQTVNFLKNRKNFDYDVTISVIPLTCLIKIDGKYNHQLVQICAYKMQNTRNVNIACCYDSNGYTAYSYKITAIFLSSISYYTIILYYRPRMSECHEKWNELSRKVFWKDYEWDLIQWKPRHEYCRGRMCGFAFCRAESNLYIWTVEWSVRVYTCRHRNLGNVFSHRHSIVSKPWRYIQRYQR